MGVPKPAQDPGERSQYLEVSLMLSAFLEAFVKFLNCKEERHWEEKGQSIIFCTAVVLRKLKTEVRTNHEREGQLTAQELNQKPQRTTEQKQEGPEVGELMPQVQPKPELAHSLPGLRGSTTSRSAYQRRR